MAVWQLSTLLLIVSHLLLRGGHVDDPNAKGATAKLPRFVKGCFDKVMVHNQ